MWSEGIQWKAWENGEEQVFEKMHSWERQVICLIGCEVLVAVSVCAKLKAEETATSSVRKARRLTDGTDLENANRPLGLGLY